MPCLFGWRLLRCCQPGNAKDARSGMWLVIGDETPVDPASAKHDGCRQGDGANADHRSNADKIGAFPVSDEVVVRTGKAKKRHASPRHVVHALDTSFEVTSVHGSECIPFLPRPMRHDTMRGTQDTR